MTTTAPTQAGPLSSDHINYLILRYLQEAGHEASATAFYRDWRRPAEYRDPEDLPFAQSVQRHELVSVIQDGLYHDELVSRVKKEGRRFNFTSNGAPSGSRPGTAGKGKGRMEQMRRGPEDFPTPPPKRQRKSEEGPQDRQLNGAAEPMEVDAASPSAGDAEDDADAASPAVQTPEPEIVEIPERYDSMDVAVQTEGKSGPKTSTMYWRLSKPDAMIMHNTFSPAKGSRTMFSAGEGVSQFYEIPSDFESGVDKISSLDDTSTGSGSVVTACAWHPQGHALAFAVDSARDIGVGGKHERRQIIKSHDARSSKTKQFQSPPLLEPAGIVLALRYSWNGSQLLAVRTNGSRGTVEVWDTDSVESDLMSNSANLRAWNIFDGRPQDAAWTAQADFVVCGDDGLLQKFRIESNQRNGVHLEQEHTPTSAGVHGLEALPPFKLAEESQNLNFDKIRASAPEIQSSATSGVPFIAAASEDQIVIQGFPDSDETRLIAQPMQDDRVTALAFRPSNAKFQGLDSSQGDNVLALAQEGGHLAVHMLHRDAKNQLAASCNLVDSSPALALAWSPDGSHLAVSGADVVQIWETIPLVYPSQRDSATRAMLPDPVVTWRRDKSTAMRGLRNGERTANGAPNGDGEEPLLEPSLSWSADGESLALAVGKEVSRRSRPSHLFEVLYANGSIDCCYPLHTSAA